MFDNVICDRTRRYLANGKVLDSSRGTVHCCWRVRHTPSRLFQPYIFCHFWTLPPICTSLPILCSHYSVHLRGSDHFDHKNLITPRCSLVEELESGADMITLWLYNQDCAQATGERCGLGWHGGLLWQTSDPYFLIHPRMSFSDSEHPFEIFKKIMRKILSLYASVPFWHWSCAEVCYI